jgi:transcriptional regulator with XRE-family HTH domain
MRVPEIGGPRAATAESPTARSAPDNAACQLALTLYRLRLERGLSLRQLAKSLGYNSHSVFADFENARRIPDERLLRSFEDHFDLPTGSLLSIRSQALVERAADMVDRRAVFLSGVASELPMS